MHARHVSPWYGFCIRWIHIWLMNMIFISLDQQVVESGLTGTFVISTVGSLVPHCGGFYQKVWRTPWKLKDMRKEGLCPLNFSICYWCPIYWRGSTWPLIQWKLFEKCSCLANSCWILHDLWVLFRFRPRPTVKTNCFAKTTCLLWIHLN